MRSTTRTPLPVRLTGIKEAGELCRHLDARQADRTGRAGRHLLFGRPETGWTSRWSISSSRRQTASFARQWTGADCTYGFDQRKHRDRPRHRHRRSSPPTATSRSPTSNRCRPGNTARRHSDTRRVGSVGPKVAQAENVRAALAFVARGEAPLGIVYATDAKVEPAVKVVGAFRSRHRPIPIRWRRWRRFENPTQRTLPRFPAIADGRTGLREIRLQLSSRRRRRGSGVLEPLTPQEWTAVVLSLRDRDGGDRWWRCRSASRSRGCWRAAVLGKIAARRARAPAAGAAAGGDRLSAAARVRHARRRSARSSTSIFGIVFSFRWTGAALACGVMAFPADGARDPAVDRGGRPAAGGRGARRSAPTVWMFAHRHAAAGAARHHRRRDARALPRALGEFGATITFVSNIPGETQTISAAIYTLTAGAGRRRAPRCRW